MCPRSFHGGSVHPRRAGKAQQAKRAASNSWFIPTELIGLISTISSDLHPLEKVTALPAKVAMAERVLVVGGGGQEHALAWKLAQSPRVQQVLVAPGNAGTASCGKISNSEVLVSNHSILARFCKDHHVGLVVVGPEAPLAAGGVDSSFLLWDQTSGGSDPYRLCRSASILSCRMEITC
ncbi:trifunctional purine biosynthetic protein adenosine-3-like isoform X2 [Xiphophorus hellerii]|uniref:trifunctional purine biosynthetic protein adenosine-3-like isoform X2 n=1 Tax=Xiphophorus hellerii TaxID=8084 RepID=UPI0013B46AD7|nr:trifunctional purine biosynthetic protein adenosine-3-like isoform X2 [Xiphophorus hellerii]